jgi:phospholipid/cholesterol/gamma-HCH transport system substrate-binding protein
MSNLQKSSKGLNENMEAAKSNFTRGYLRKERAAAKKKEALEKSKNKKTEKKEFFFLNLKATVKD